MKFRWLEIWLVCVVLSVGSPADTIRLKNGTSINADSVTEKGDQVQYSIGTTTYQIPKWSVERIDRGSSFGVSVSTIAPGTLMPSTSRGTASPSEDVPQRVIARKELRKNLPTTTPPKGVDDDALRQQILNLGRIDSRALLAIESEGNADKSSAAYFEAARFELEHNNPEAARVYLQRSLTFTPDRADLLDWYVQVLIESGRYSEALPYAEQATQLEPQSAYTWSWLGHAYYQSGKLNDAVRSWKRSLEVQSSENVRNWLAKAERENSVEDSFTEQQGVHFSLRYQGRQAGFSLRSDLLRTLERQYGELARDWDFAPQANIAVILYTEQEFRGAITGAPSWAEGLNDGKLRIPVKDVSRITPELQDTLKHELAHSFVYFITQGRCPGWLNEGIAQMAESRNAADQGRMLARLWQQRKQFPLRTLEPQFDRLSRAEAEIAYPEALAVTEYLRSNYGMSGLKRVLLQLQEGDSPEVALRTITQFDYAHLEKEFGDYLVKTYGD